MPRISEVIAHSLQANGVEVVFGIPSVHNIGLYDALRDTPGIRHILCRHEGTATHMADGYARSSGKVGVVIASTGPGVLYTLSPLLEAWSSCSPVLVITSNVRASQIGKKLGTLHEIHDQAGIFENATKANVQMTLDKDIASQVEAVLSAALSGRPGPVFLEVPTNFWDMAVPEGKPAASRPPSTTGSTPDLDTAIRLLEKAERPVIIAGIEALNAGLSPVITTLAESMGAPVLTDAGGKGVLSEDHPLAFGNATRRVAIEEIHPVCDVTLAIGSRLRYVDFGRRGVTLPKLIHVDWDDAWVNRNYTAEVQLLGDVGGIAASLAERLGKISPPSEREVFAADRRKRIDTFTATVTAGKKEAAYMGVIRQAIPPEGQLVSDNTMLGYFAELIYPVLSPGGFVTARGAMPIGFSFAAAIGAKLADPTRVVVGIIGDGGFLYSTQEMATCVQHGIGFPMIVVNDGAYKMIDCLQQASYSRGYQTELKNPDFVALARSYGVEGVMVDSPETLGEALNAALAAETMQLIELVDSFPDPPFGRM